MEEFMYSLRIPKDRVAVLIGRNGETKKEIEELALMTLEIDSHEGDVVIKGSDPIKLYSAREIVKAIARGFNPEIARNLIKQDYVYEQISIKDFAKNPQHLKRLKGRVIGTDGKSRKAIEDLTDASISVYGKTIGVIGLPESVDLARRAIETLLSGSPHSNVYKWLERRKRDLYKSSLEPSSQE
jgi:ribosomal RNA assembly protein